MIVRNIQDLHRAMENNLEKKKNNCGGNDYDPPYSSSTRGLFY